MSSHTTSHPILWQPGQDQILHAQMTGFRQWCANKWSTELPDFSSLYDWSIQHRADFWQSVLEFSDLKFHHSPDAILREPGPFRQAEWFPGATLNFAENLLRYRDDKPALVFWNEQGCQRQLTYRQLYGEVERCGRALDAVGVKKGDRVAGFLPNCPEAIIAMLAATSRGAIWSSCSPDFGLQGVLDRFGQIEPKVLLCADGYFYNGKTFDCLQRTAGIVEKTPSIEKVVVIPYAQEYPAINHVPRSLIWHEFLPKAQPDWAIPFTALPFDHPLYIMYSSGTTGVPKCIVHGAGGTLLQHWKELALHTNLTRDDCIFYFTTCGWMMWNWLVSSLSVGAKVVLFDGSPFAPDPHHLWKMAEQENITLFGTSAKYLSALEKAEVTPGGDHDLSSLRTILSTGSPLDPASFDFVYRDIKKDLCLSSISGGTDIISCFALGNPAGPVRRGELQTRGLGMAVEVFDENGKSLVGEPGELVCTKPFPSRPIYFWNDPDGKKYHDAYFDTFDNTWRHGDWTLLTPQGGVIIYGRSDATLNPSGVRIGTAEIYRQVDQIDEVLESLVVGQDWKSDQRIILFVKLKPGLELDESLIHKIKQKIRSETTPRHVPAKILSVTDIPRTISGKIVELAVRNLIHGRPVKNRDALANPDSLAQYQNRPELDDD